MVHLQSGAFRNCPGLDERPAQTTHDQLSLGLPTARVLRPSAAGIGGRDGIEPSLLGVAAGATGGGETQP